MTAKLEISAYFPDGEPTQANSIDLTWEEETPDLGVILAVVRSMLGRVPDQVVVAEPSLLRSEAPPPGLRSFRAGRLLLAGQSVAADHNAEVWPLRSFPAEDAGVAFCRGLALEQVGAGEEMRFVPDGAGSGEWRSAAGIEALNGAGAA